MSKITETIADVVHPELGPLSRTREGIYHRTHNNSNEVNMVSPCKRQAADMPLLPTDRVLDLGAHIGSFSFYALKAGVAQVVAVEALKDVAALCRYNLDSLDHPDATTLHAAAVPDEHEGDTVEIWLSGSDANYTASISKKRRAESVLVPAVRFRELLETVTVLKIDIEGGEYPLDWANLPPTLRLIALELHPHPFREITLRRIMKQGFRRIESWEALGLLGDNYILERTP